VENLVALMVHLIVGGEDALRELDVAANDGVEGDTHLSGAHAISDLFAALLLKGF
jgi:hypothetical protein